MTSLARFVIGVYIWLLAVSMIEYVAEGDWLTTLMGVALSTPGIWLYRKLGKIREQKAYDVFQKEYALVLISDRIVEDSNRHPYEKEVDGFFHTGKLKLTYEFTHSQWVNLLNEPPVPHEPTYMIVTAHPHSKVEKAWKQPFVMTANPLEVLHFLEFHK